MAENEMARDIIDSSQREKELRAESEHRRGTVYLSCGHEADTGCSGVDVTWEAEECVAGEGFLPVTMFGVFCHKCAQTFAYEEGKAAAVKTIEAQAAEIERLREALEQALKGTT